MQAVLADFEARLQSFYVQSERRLYLHDQLSVSQQTNTVMSTCIKQTKSTSAIKNMPSDNASMARFYYLAHGTDGSVTVKT